MPKQQACVQPRYSAVNTTLPAFAAERRAAERRCCWVLAPAAAGRCPARGALSSKPHARRSDCRTTGTDRQTDGRTDDRYI